MIIFEKCAVTSCNREVYEDEKLVLGYCLGHAWLDRQYEHDILLAKYCYGDYNGPAD